MNNGFIVDDFMAVRMNKIGSIGWSVGRFFQVEVSVGQLFASGGVMVVCVFRLVVYLHTSV